MAGLTASLESFGDISGLVWNRRTGNLVAGHQRLAALQSKYGEALVVEDSHIVIGDGKKFPIREVDWPESKEKLANVAANNPHIAGEFEDEELVTLLDELEASEGGLYAALRLECLLPPGPPDEAAWADMMEDAAGEASLPGNVQISFTLSRAYAERLRAALKARDPNHNVAMVKWLDEITS
jgi:hypothetical protein